MNDPSSERVRFQNGEVSLAGTLVTPGSKGPHPAVVFIHGSGRDTLGSSFADHFAKYGIAGLVYDKRGTGESTGEFPRDAISSFGDLANDALAGLAFLQSRDEIDANRIGFWGGSQGGWVGPLAASRSDNVAFVISVSGPGVDAHTQMNFAVPNLLRADGRTEREIKEVLDDRALGYDLLRTIAKTGDGWDKLEALAGRARDKKWAYQYQEFDETWFDRDRGDHTGLVEEDDQSLLEPQSTDCLEKGDLPGPGHMGSTRYLRYLRSGQRQHLDL